MVELKIGESKILLNFSCIFAALILAMNGLRYLLNIQESSALTYTIYSLFLITTISVSIGKVKFTRNREIGFWELMICFMLVYALGSISWGGKSAASLAIKLVMMMAVCLLFSKFTLEDYRSTINIFYLVCGIYIAKIIIAPSKIDRYLIRGSNYLNLTLPIGLMLTMLLARIIYWLYSRKETPIPVIEIIFAAITFVSLTLFTGRGSLIFPFIVAIIVTLLLGRKHFFKLLATIILLLLAIFVAYQYFMKNANAYIVNRMVNLFQSNRSEDRWMIWKLALDYANSHKWYLIGGGVGAYERAIGYYPHNIYFHIIGEFGLIGIALSVYTTVLTVKRQFMVFRDITDLSDRRLLLFYEIGSGLLYLFLNFMKSFSFYDSLILLMFLTATISSSYQILESEQTCIC